MNNRTTTRIAAALITGTCGLLMLPAAHAGLLGGGGGNLGGSLGGHGGLAGSLGSRSFDANGGLAGQGQQDLRLPRAVP